MHNVYLTGHDRTNFICLEQALTITQCEMPVPNSVYASS